MYLNKKFWNNKTLAVTGSTGFVGKRLIKIVNSELENKINLIEITRKKYDLTEYNDLKKIFKNNQIDYMIHLAATVGGIGANQKNPAKFFYENAFMGINLMHLSYINKIKKFVTLASVCGYPQKAKIPFKEEDLWKGYPEETNAPYGIAKKILTVQSEAYRKQYKFNSIVLYPVNLYGPGDNFDLNTSHVIPALIRKVLYAKKTSSNSIKVWGDGKAYREFLYVDDLVEAILLATEKYNNSEPINIGTGDMISIKSLVKLICKKCEYTGNIEWEKNKPNGQIYRQLDVSKSKKYIGFQSKTNIEEGLEKTINWYKNNH
tara:strand:+ start:580 stop:1533 length:954 start_codon:yes stop_codon:yes gene_type:complete